jgi:hypothetical protein
MPNRPKKRKVKNVVDGKVYTIYGILNLKTNKLIKVDLDESALWFDFDMNMYDEETYSVVKLNILLER